MAIPTKTAASLPNRFFTCLLIVILFMTCCMIASAQRQAPAGNSVSQTDLLLSKPESVGFSSDRLESLHTLMQQAVDKKQVSGAVTILARHSKVVDYRAYGLRNIANGDPMTRDTIFRILSMTKPVTGVAMMILWEEGKWLPTDPISKYVPEFTHLKVFKGVDATGNIVVEDPIHPPTMYELMSHTAGFTYGVFGSTPVDKAYQTAGVLRSTSLEEMISRLAKLPLLYQPGTQWVYSVSADIQGYIIEKLSGQSLPDFTEQHILKPLGMKDTGFYVPADKRRRFATVYRTNEQSELIEAVSRPGAGSSPLGDFAERPTMPSGGGGLVSTAADYARFAQMLADNGEFNGVRILSPSAVKLMTLNHLAPGLLTGEFAIGWHIFRPGLGYGYDCAVEYDPPEANLPGGRGTVFWDGAAGTWFWADPTNDIVFVGMIQRILTDPNIPTLEYQSRSVVYQALLDPKK